MLSQQAIAVPDTVSSRADPQDGCVSLSDGRVQWTLC